MSSNADYSADEATFQRSWSSKAGETSALARAVVELNARSAAAFIAKKDDVANALRDAATAINEMSAAAQEVAKFVDARLGCQCQRPVGRRVRGGGEPGDERATPGASRRA